MNRAAIAALLVACSAAAQEPITFKGLPMGASSSDFRQSFPGAQCMADTCSVRPLDACRKAHPGEPIAECLRRYTYGGRIPASISAAFENEALVSVLVEIGTASFDPLSTSITERHGKPDQDETFDIQNRAGATFDNRRQRWIRGDVVLTLTKRAGTVDRGSVYITSLERAKRNARDREQKAKEGAKDL